MEAITKITTCEDIALITLRNSPSDLHFIAKAFGMIAEKNINVDMISQTAPLGGCIDLSFTVAGEDLGGVLEVFAKLRGDFPDLKSDISSGNCKISIYGEPMRDIPGVAARAFEIISGLGVDVRLITTSEIDISVLLPKSDFDAVAARLKKELHL